MHQPNKRLHPTRPLVTPLAGAWAAPIDFAGEANVRWVSQLGDLNSICKRLVVAESQGVTGLGGKQGQSIGLIVLGILLGVHLAGCGGPRVPVESLPPDSRTEVFDATPTRVFLASLEVFAKKWIDVVQSDQDQGIIIFGPVYDSSAKELKRRAPEEADNLWGEDRRSGSTFLSPLPKAEPSIEPRNSDLDPYVKTGVLEPAAQALLLKLEPLDGYRTRATVSGVCRDVVTYSSADFETEWYPDYPGVQVRGGKLKDLFKEIRKVLSTASRVKRVVDVH